MLFLYQKPMVKAIYDKLNIDITDSEYKNTVFSVDSVVSETPGHFPFDRTYKGSVLIFHNERPLYHLRYIIRSHENIPEQSVCLIEFDEQVNETLV